MSPVKSEFSTPPEVNISTPKWRDLHELEMLTQVQIREQAARDGLVALWEIDNALLKADQNILGIAKWRERISEFNKHQL